MWDVIEQANKLQVGDFVQIFLDDDLTWLHIVNFIGKHEIVGIPLFPEIFDQTCHHPRVRIFKQQVIQCSKRSEWDSPDFFMWLAKQKII